MCIVSQWTVASPLTPSLWPGIFNIGALKESSKTSTYKSIGAWEKELKDYLYLIKPGRSGDTGLCSRCDGPKGLFLEMQLQTPN